MAPRRPVAPASGDERGGLSFETKFQKMHTKLNKSLGVQCNKIVAQYRTSAEEVRARTQEKIDSLGQRVKGARRSQFDQLAELVKRRDAKMVTIARKLAALKVDLEAFAGMLDAESKRLQDEIAQPWAAGAPAALPRKARFEGANPPG